MMRLLSTLGLVAVLFVGILRSQTPPGIAFTENTTNGIASAAIATSPQIGTYLAWIIPSDVSNVSRGIFGKNGGTQGVTILKRTPDGTQARMTAGRSTTGQTVDTPSGAMVAGVPICMAFQFDIAGGSPTSYTGSVLRPLTDVTTSAVNGSGTHTSTNGQFFVGKVTGAAVNAMGMTVLAFAASTVRLTVPEMRDWQAKPSPNLRGVEVFWRLGDNGNVYVQDFTVNAYHGTVTGAVMSGLDVWWLKPWRGTP